MKKNFKNTTVKLACELKILKLCNLLFCFKKDKQ